MAMNQELDGRIQMGLRAHDLATRHGLGDRLPTGMLDGLLSDIEALKKLIPATSTARRALSVSADAQKNVLRRAYRLVRGVRFLARKAGVASDVRKAYGVGAACNPVVHHQVVSLVEQILARVADAPGEANAIGIVDEDIANFRAALADVLAAEVEQRTAQIESPKTTAERIETTRRVMVAVGRIAAAGLTRFANQPLAAEFAAIGGAVTTRRKKKEDAEEKKSAA